MASIRVFRELRLVRSLAQIHGNGKDCAASLCFIPSRLGLFVQMGKVAQGLWPTWHKLEATYRTNRTIECNRTNKTSRTTGRHEVPSYFRSTRAFEVNSATILQALFTPTYFPCPDRCLAECGNIHTTCAFPTHQLQHGHQVQPSKIPRERALSPPYRRGADALTAPPRLGLHKSASSCFHVSLHYSKHDRRAACTSCLQCNEAYGMPCAVPHHLKAANRGHAGRKQAVDRLAELRAEAVAQAARQAAAAEADPLNVAARDSQRMLPADALVDGFIRPQQGRHLQTIAPRMTAPQTVSEVGFLGGVHRPAGHHWLP